MQSVSARPFRHTSGLLAPLQASAEMQDRGEIYATQGEDRVSIREASGPIRLRLVDHPDAVT